MNNTTENNMSGLLAEFVRITPGDSPAFLQTLAKSFIRHNIIAPGATFLGSEDNLKQTLQRKLTQNDDRISESNVLQSFRDSRTDITLAVNAKTKRAAILFRALLILPCAVMLSVFLLNLIESPGTTTFWIIMIVFAITEGVLFYVFRGNSREAMLRETELFRLQLLESRLEIVQRVTTPEIKTALYQIIAQNLLADQQAATQMVVHNWGNIGKMVVVGKQQGNILLNTEEIPR